MILLPLTYLGPLQLFCRYFQEEKILIEQHDNYQKQSYRNRCDIYGANGKLSLIIPVQHIKGKRLKVSEIKIDYATDWRRLHWKGIESAYNSSPFFEYYRDIFEPYYKKEYVFLLEFCVKLNVEVLKILNVKNKPELTQGFLPLQVHPDDTFLKYHTLIDQVITEEIGFAEPTSGNLIDLRSIIHPKIRIDRDTNFKNIEYTQVFSQQHGFIPNLSVLDLIFNKGPEAGTVLRSCLL